MTGQAADHGGAIVLGGDYRGLGLVRSLGRRGIPVWVIGDDHRVALFSRYTSRRLTWPSDEETHRIEWLIRLAARYKLDRWVLFPTSDTSAATLERNRHVLSQRFCLTTSPWESMRWAHDKRLLYCLAKESGLDQPQTCWYASKQELAAVDCTFPVILKPAVKSNVNEFTQDKAWRADNREVLLNRYDKASTLVDPETILVQELVPGGSGSLFAYAALCIEGRPLASMVTQSFRQYPEDFGRFSTYVETIELPEVEAPARRLLERLHCSGLVQVQFKRDSSDGRYKLLDVNMRAWGSHSLGQAAGVDFPYLLWRLSRAENVPEVRARPAVRWIRLLPDMLVAGRSMLRRTLSPAAYLRSLRPPLVDAVIARDDPIPCLAELVLLLETMGQRWLAKLAA